MDFKASIYFLFLNHSGHFISFSYLVFHAEFEFTEKTESGRQPAYQDSSPATISKGAQDEQEQIDCSNGSLLRRYS